MNKLKNMVYLLLGILLLTGCGNAGSKLETVTYKLAAMPGTTSTITFEYDKDKNIQKTTTKSEVIFADSAGTKEDYEKINESADAMYETMKGVTHTTKFSDDKMTETLVVTVKDVSKESLPVLFATAVKDGKVSLDDYTKNLETIGYTKE